MCVGACARGHKLDRNTGHVYDEINRKQTPVMTGV